MKKLLLFGVPLLLCGNVNAAIISLNQTVDLDGPSVLHKTEILSLQGKDRNNPGVEKGCVAANSSGNKTNTGCGFGTYTGDIKSSALAGLDDLGLPTASAFRIVLSSNENNEESITVDQLDIVLYQQDGAIKQIFSLLSPVSILDADQGHKVNYVFGLDAGSTATLQGLLGGGYLIGAKAQFSNTQAGADGLSLYTAVLPRSGDPVVPEPSTWALMATGLSVVIAGRRKLFQ